jgi:quercetin dioxygenase-like cupin family protein
MKYAMTCLLLSAAVITLSLSSASAQERKGDIKAVPLVTKDVTGVPGKEMTIIRIEIPPGADSGLHTHPGDEHGTVLEGSLLVKVGDADYKPVAAGETFYAPPNTPMGIKNTSDKPVTVMNVLILEKGKPRSTLVQRP